MPRFRKKPVVIEAVQFTGKNQDEIIRFGGKDVGFFGRVSELRIRTLEGMMHVSTGDWVIRGVKGEIYPCKPEIFAETYEAFEGA